ncbi:hypothetical protein L5G32_09295 [Gordonia sp. HY002]|uniref:hypothetical protein n=1 Tax=Gordonia zhenghanii TaxID=2911516 RepID=UPI001EF0605E|nr:hypothetical protein [Gordonia zhenghanii]MCF8570460.1 hypothetical protein [Gordonia zhenghanii]MCF8602583.1 hypothetical protein [Gordonia zhenghanii]
MELLAVFTAAPEFTVLAGRNEVGKIDVGLLTDDVEGPRVLLLGGRSWMVTHIDWKRRHAFVESTDIAGIARWQSIPDGVSFEIARGARDVLLGAVPEGVTLTKRAAEAIAAYRAQRSPDVVADALVVRRDDKGDWHWWTWAGAKANRTLGCVAARAGAAATTDRCGIDPASP